jgi:hypothetical protein
MKRILTAALIAVISIAELDAGKKHSPSSQTPSTTWDLKYKEGSFQLRKEQWLEAAFVADPSAEKAIDPVVVIATDQVRSVYFKRKAQKDSDLVEHRPRSGCAYANRPMPKNDSAARPAFFLAWIESPSPISRAADHLNRRYPVKLIWADGSSEREIVLSVDHCEYASFLANVRSFLGTRWPSVGREFPGTKPGKFH